MDERTQFRKRLLKIILPITFQQIMLGLVSASDALMLGALSQDALSAVSLASQVSFVENMFLAALTAGLSILAAQYWGKGDAGAVERVFAYTMKVTAALSAAFFLAGLLAPTWLMRFFTNEQPLIDRGAVYLRAVSPAFLLTGLSQVYQTALKNSGRAGIASAVSCMSVVANIGLNALFIFGLFGLPRMEIAGAALATVLARVLEAVWCVLETARPGRVKLRTVNIIHDDKLLRADFWKYTWPVLGNQIVWGVGFTMYSVIMGHLGTDAVAANSIANIVKNLLSSLCFGLGLGGGILLGNELGAGRLDRAREYGDAGDTVPGGPERAGDVLSQVDAHHVHLQHGGHEHERDDHQRRVPRRGRQPVRVLLRHGDHVVLLGAHGVCGGVRAEMAGAGGLFHHQPGRDGEAAGGVPALQKV